jgi:hypothetical protein
MLNYFGKSKSLPQNGQGGELTSGQMQTLVQKDYTLGTLKPMNMYFILQLILKQNIWIHHE